MFFNYYTRCGTALARKTTASPARRLALTSCSAFQLAENSWGLRGRAVAILGPCGAAGSAGRRQNFFLLPFPRAPGLGPAAPGSAGPRFAMWGRGTGIERAAAAVSSAPRSSGPPGNAAPRCGSGRRGRACAGGPWRLRGRPALSRPWGEPWGGGSLGLGFE